MNRKLKCTIIMILVLVMLSGCGKNTELRFGAGNREGMYYAYAEKLDQLSGDALSLRIRSTTGSAANLRLLAKGFLDIAIVQNDNLYESIDDASSNGSLSFSAVCSLYTEAVQIVVRSDSDIHTLEDLKNKIVSVGEEDSGTGQNAKELLLLHGMSFADMDVRYYSLTEAVSALRGGGIDAFFYTSGAPAQGLKNLAEDTSIRLLSLSDEDIQRMKNLYPDYVECVIPAGTYRGLNENVQTLGVRAVLLAANDLDEDTVRKLTETIFLHADELREGMVPEGTYSASYAVESITIPFHPGAASFWKDKGAIVQTNESRKKTPVVGGQDE